MLLLRAGIRREHFPGTGVPVLRLDVPDVLRWAGSSLGRTVRAMPDSTPDVQRWACSRWRDEAGGVMRELRGGYAARQPACRGPCTVPPSHR